MRTPTAGNVSASVTASNAGGGEPPGAHQAFGPKVHPHQEGGHEE
ncbi:hypothetical protein [Erythrobacter mangrovi]|nr:hypothetical protein [Erythrobacter mangrovi]